MLGWFMLACSVLIDVDHPLQESDSSALTVGTLRPHNGGVASRALLVPACRGTCARGYSAHSRRRGMVSTRALFGNVATVPLRLLLWWPVSRAGVESPYRPCWWYVLALILLIAVPLIPCARAVWGEPSEHVVEAW